MVIKLKNKLNKNNECFLPLSVDALMAQDWTKQYVKTVELMYSSCLLIKY